VTYQTLFLDQEGQNGGYAHDHAAGQEASVIDSDGGQTVKVTLTKPTPLTDTKLFVRVAAQ